MVYSLIAQISALNSKAPQFESVSEDSGVCASKAQRLISTNVSSFPYTGMIPFARHTEDS